jgi:hypothetical protein
LSFFFFNAREKIQQNIHKQICNQFNLGIEPGASFGTEKLVGKEHDKIFQLQVKLGK